MDCYSFIIQKVNPFSLEGKFESLTDRNWVNTLWGKCIPQDLYKYICLRDIFMLVSQLKITFQNSNMILTTLLKQTLTVYSFCKIILKITQQFINMFL